MAKTTTPNYNWQVPEDDELIRDGAQAIKGLGTAVDADLKKVDDVAAGAASAVTSHTHSQYADKAHTHSQYAATSHTHQYTDVQGLAVAGNDFMRLGMRVVAGHAIGTTLTGGYQGLMNISVPVLSSVSAVVVCNGDANIAVVVAVASVAGKVVTVAARDFAGVLKGNTRITVNYYAMGL